MAAPFTTTNLNGVKVYNLASGKTLPEWLKEKSRAQLKKDEGTQAAWQTASGAPSGMALRRSLWWRSLVLTRCACASDFWRHWCCVCCADACILTCMWYSFQAPCGAAARL